MHRFVCRIPRFVLIAVCLSAITVLACASPPLPWERQNSVRNALTAQSGQVVTCEGVVVRRIVARNAPAYFVIQDALDVGGKMVVLCRAPLELYSGQTIEVRGTVGTLQNGERCISYPTISAYCNADGSFAPLMSVFPFTEWPNRRSLSIPDSPVPPSDPSMPSDGTGVAGPVTAQAQDGAICFDSVAAMLAANPAVLSRIELSSKPIKEVGEGYILVGDDTSNAGVKVYTAARVRPTDRLVKLTGVVHSESGALVVYAGNGPAPYFDPQGVGGVVRVASEGTVAYAATIKDASATDDDSFATNGVPVGPVRTNNTTAMTGVMPGLSTGTWVYLTGQVVTYVGRYYSFDLQPSQWVNVYNIQGIGRTPGMRVWNPTSQVSKVGSVVDVMAQLDTKDGQRVLGMWSWDQWGATDRNSTAHTIETKILVEDGSLPAARPAGMANRDICGPSQGNNLGVTNGSGLYSVGSFVQAWGMVLETGNYLLNPSSQETVPYMRIDDGNQVVSGGDGGSVGVLVLGSNTYPDYTSVGTGDMVVVKGVSSVWKPVGSSDTYRGICVPDEEGVFRPSAQTRAVTGLGSITGTVKLYDMPDATATVHLYSTCGKIETLTITRQSDYSGSATFSWDEIPQDVTVGGVVTHPQYIVSAECDGFKTRTYTRVAPGTPATTRNLYLVPLRKLYVTTNGYYINPCSDGSPTSTVITATVVDGNYQPVPGVVVRFRTDKGSFLNNAVVHSTLGCLTNSQGQGTATLYGVASEWGEAKIEATDDSAPLLGDDPNGDLYHYDWLQLHDQYCTPTTVTITRPSVAIEPFTVSHARIDKCGDIESVIQATVAACGAGMDGVPVTFDTTLGVFEDGSTHRVVTTHDGGIASVRLKGVGSEGTATVNAEARPYGAYVHNSANIAITTDSFTLAVTPVVGQTGQLVSVLANVKDAAGNNISGRRVYFNVTGGTLDTPATGYADTNSLGNAEADVRRATTGDLTVTADEHMSCGTTLTKVQGIWFFDTAPDDWPMFMHDPQHTGASKTWDIAPEMLTREWVVDLPVATTVRTAYWPDGSTLRHPNPASPSGGGSDIFEHPYIDSSPVVVGNRVVVGTWTGGDYFSATGSVKAFDAANNGNLLWTAAVSPAMGGVASTPCISNGRVYVGSTNGYLYCLDLITGNQIWTRQTTDRSTPAGSSRIISSPVVYDGVVYITNEASKVYAFTADANGTPVSGYPVELPIASHGITDVSQQNITGASSPSIAVVGPNTYLMVGCDDGCLYRIKLSDRTRAEIALGGCIESSPAISGNNAYVGVSIWHGRNLQRITVEPLARVASWNLVEESRATPSLMYNFVYDGVDTGTVFHRVDAAALGDDLTSGPGNNFFGGDYFVGSAAHTTGGIIYTGNDSGRFFALDAGSMTELVAGGYYDDTVSSTGFICSSPAIAYNVDSNHNRWVFVTTRSDGGRLYAFKSVR